MRKNLTSEHDIAAYRIKTEEMALAVTIILFIHVFFYFVQNTYKTDLNEKSLTVTKDQSHFSYGQFLNVTKFIRS